MKGEVIKVIKVAGTSSGIAEGMGGEYSGASSVSGYSVQIRIEPSELISGMSAKAKIFLTKKSNVLCVPYDIIQEDESGNNFILVGVENTDGSFTAEKRAVTVGDEVNYYIEVIGGDVAEGDLVILDLIVSEGETFDGIVSMGDVMIEDEFIY